MPSLSERTGSGRTSTGYLDLIRSNPDFRKLWFGQIISLLGDWFNLIASATLVSKLTASGLAIGGLFVVRMLAPFLISPVAGVLADRYDRRVLLIATDISRGFTVLGFLVVREPSHVWLLYTLTAIQLAISGVFFPTRNAIIPDLVTPTDLGAANALSGTTWSVMLAFGAALGGLVAGSWGIYRAFVVDASTFFISAIFITSIKYRKVLTDGQKGLGIRSALRDYMGGLRYLAGEPDISSVTLHKAAMGLAVSGGFQVATVAIGEQVFPIGEGGSISLGIIMATIGIGTGVGPLVSRWITGDHLLSLRKALLAAYLITALGLAIVAPLASLPIVLAGTLIRSVGNGINWVQSTQLLLGLVPNRMLGRVFSTEFALFTLATAGSSFASGWLLDHTEIGLTGLLWLMAGVTLAPALLWSLWLRFGEQKRSLEQSPSPADTVDRRDSSLT